MMSLKVMKDVAGRIVALFLVSAVGAVTSSAAMNELQSTVQVPLWYAASMAGIMAVVNIVGKLAQAALDGKVEAHEVDAIFGVKEETRAAVNESKGAAEPVVEDPVL
jgi:surface polysaccharide O-acyltransferase-like enzyme